MVDKVQSTDHDKCASDPERARVPTKNDLLLRLGTDVNVIGNWDHDAIINRMRLLALNDRASG